TCRQVSSYFILIFRCMFSPCSVITSLFPAPTRKDIYTLSLHDALPISGRPSTAHVSVGAWRALIWCASSGWSPDQPSSPSSRRIDRKSTRLNSSHGSISYAVFCLKKKNTINNVFRKFSDFHDE